MYVCMLYSIRSYYENFRSAVEARNELPEELEIKLLEVADTVQKGNRMNIPNEHFMLDANTEKMKLGSKIHQATEVVRKTKSFDKTRR